MTTNLTIRRAVAMKDYDGNWAIFSNVIKSGDTYVFGPHTPKEAAQKYWFAEGIDSFVAVDRDGNILGT